MPPPMTRRTIDGRALLAGAMTLAVAAMLLGGQRSPLVAEDGGGS